MAEASLGRAQRGLFLSEAKGHCTGPARRASSLSSRASAGRPLATPRTATPAWSLDDPGRAPAAVLGENLGRNQQRGGRWSQLTPAASFAPPGGGVSPESMSFRGPGECVLSPITEQSPEHHRAPEPGAVPSPGVLSHPVSASSSRDCSLVQDVSQAQQRDLTGCGLQRLLCAACPQA